MKPELLGRATALAADIKHVRGFIDLIPVHRSANALIALKAIYQDYPELSIDYMNSDLLDVMAKARLAAQAHLDELQKKFEEL